MLNIFRYGTVHSTVNSTMQTGLKRGATQRVAVRPLYATIFPMSSNISRYSSTTSPVVPSVVPAVVPSNLVQPNKATLSASHKIAEKVKEEFHRFVNGSKLLGQNTKAAALLVRNMAKGHTLTRRERTLMIRTIADLFRMVPFIVILVIPFAEFALPILLKVFPNMLPSTFTSASQKETARLKKLQAKLKVIEVLQAASESMVLRGKLDSKDVHESLITFMGKVSRGEEIQPAEVLKISDIFRKEFSFESLDRSQLVSLSKFFGIPSLGTSFILQETLRFKWNLVAKDDVHIVRDGIDSLTPVELEDAANSRGYSHSNPHQDQKQYIQEWVTLSQANVPPYLLLLSRVHYFVKNTKRVTDISPPIIAPYLPLSSDVSLATMSIQAPIVPETEVIVDIPEKEIVSAEFKNLSHELSYDPVVAKLWDRIARFTSDLKKETFGGQENVIHLGDASADNVGTVITAELRQYLQALFVALDKNCDGKLSVDEVEHGLQASDIRVSRDEISSLVKQHDTDGDDCLAFDEFVDCLLYMRKNQL